MKRAKLILSSVLLVSVVVIGFSRANADDEIIIEGKPNCDCSTYHEGRLLFRGISRTIVEDGVPYTFCNPESCR